MKYCSFCKLISATDELYNRHICTEDHLFKLRKASLHKVCDTCKTYYYPDNNTPEVHIVSHRHIWTSVLEAFGGLDKIICKCKLQHGPRNFLEQYDYLGLNFVVRCICQDAYISAYCCLLCGYTFSPNRTDESIVDHLHSKEHIENFLRVKAPEYITEFFTLYDGECQAFIESPKHRNLDQKEIINNVLKVLRPKIASVVETRILYFYTNPQYPDFDIVDHILDTYSAISANDTMSDINEHVETLAISLEPYFKDYDKPHKTIQQPDSALKINKSNSIISNIVEKNAVMDTLAEEPVKNTNNFSEIINTEMNNKFVVLDSLTFTNESIENNGDSTLNNKESLLSSSETELGGQKEKAYEEKSNEKFEQEIVDVQSVNKAATLTTNHAPLVNMDSNNNDNNPIDENKKKEDTDAIVEDLAPKEKIYNVVYDGMASLLQNLKQEEKASEILDTSNFKTVALSNSNPLPRTTQKSKKKKKKNPIPPATDGSIIAPQNKVDLNILFKRLRTFIIGMPKVNIITEDFTSAPKVTKLFNSLNKAIFNITWPDITSFDENDQHNLNSLKDRLAILTNKFQSNIFRVFQKTKQFNNDEFSDIILGMLDVLVGYKELSLRLNVNSCNTTTTINTVNNADANGDIYAEEIYLRDHGHSSTSLSQRPRSPDRMNHHSSRRGHDTIRDSGILNHNDTSFAGERRSSLTPTTKIRKRGTRRSKRLNPEREKRLKHNHNENESFHAAHTAHDYSVSHGSRHRATEKRSRPHRSRSKSRSLSKRQHGRTRSGASERSERREHHSAAAHRRSKPRESDSSSRRTSTHDKQQHSTRRHHHSQLSSSERKTLEDGLDKLRGIVSSQRALFRLHESNPNTDHHSMLSDTVLTLQTALNKLVADLDFMSALRKDKHSQHNNDILDHALQNQVKLLEFSQNSNNRPQFITNDYINTNLPVNLNQNNLRNIAPGNYQSNMNFQTQSYNNERNRLRDNNAIKYDPFNAIPSDRGIKYMDQRDVLYEQEIKNNSSNFIPMMHAPDINNVMMNPPSNNFAGVWNEFDLQDRNRGYKAPQNNFLSNSSGHDTNKNSLMKQMRNVADNVANYNQGLSPHKKGSLLVNQPKSSNGISEKRTLIERNVSTSNTTSSLPYKLERLPNPALKKTNKDSGKQGSGVNSNTRSGFTKELQQIQQQANALPKASRDSYQAIDYNKNAAGYDNLRRPILCEGGFIDQKSSTNYKVVIDNNNNTNMQNRKLQPANNYGHQEQQQYHASRNVPQNESRNKNIMVPPPYYPTTNPKKDDDSFSYQMFQDQQLAQLSAQLGDNAIFGSTGHVSGAFDYTTPVFNANNVSGMSGLITGTPPSQQHQSHKAMSNFINTDNYMLGPSRPNDVVNSYGGAGGGGLLLQSQPQQHVYNPNTNFIYK